MWDWLKDLTFQIIESLYNITGDWGLAIIVITIILRLLLAPLMKKQITSSYNMQKMQPIMQDLQNRYKDNPARLQEEMQKIYAESHFNPLAGCLPILIQMPIFILLFQVLREMGERTQGTTYEFYHIVPSLVTPPSVAIGQGIVIFIPYVILMVLFAGATFLPLYLQQRNNDSPQKKQTLMMAGFMSLFMLWVSWSSPAGVLLFWVTSALIGVGQQQITMAVLKKEDAKKQASTPEIKPVEVQVVRKEKKKRPKKSH